MSGRQHKHLWRRQNEIHYFPIVYSEMLHLGSMYTIKSFKNWNAEGKELPMSCPKQRIESKLVAAEKGRAILLCGKWHLE